MRFLHLRYHQGVVCYICYTHEFCVATTPEITNKLTKKRKLRIKWKLSKNPIDKTNFNRTTRELKKLIEDFNNDTIHQRLLKLTNTVNTDFFLWKITKRLNQPQHHPLIKKTDGDWARNDAQKAEKFAQHLAEVFTPVWDQVDNMGLLEYLECPLPMNSQKKRLSTLYRYLMQSSARHTYLDNEK